MKEKEIAKVNQLTEDQIIAKNIESDVQKAN